MNKPNESTEAVRKWARAVVEFDTSHRHTAIGSNISPLVGPFSVFETLRASLSKTIGVVGYQALLARGLALAQRELPELATVLVREDGSLSGLVVTEAVPELTVNGCVEILTQLLRLLVTFVGERLTLLLIRDAWPEMILGTVETDDEAIGSEDSSE